MKVNVNEKSVEVTENCTILDALAAAKEPLADTKLGKAKEWIRNPRCPLLSLAEVNGELIPYNLLSGIVYEGMSISTNSPRVQAAISERAALLTDRHECFFIKEWQKMTAAEAESSGFINMEEWEQYSFPERAVEPSIRYNPNKCVRCKACIETCRDIQGVEALSFGDEVGIVVDEERCTRCGQCILHCPTAAITKYEAIHDFFGCEGCPFSAPVGAMAEVDETGTAWDLLLNPNLFCVAQFAPAVRASIGEEFGIPDGDLVTRKLYAALRKLGFKQVWDTNFAADLTIMEEGTELIERIMGGGRLPMFTSCSPGWIRFAEYFFPELLPHLSTAKSPQQMFGAIAKSYGAKVLGVAPEAMRVVSIMPCTAKKAEAARKEMSGAAGYSKEPEDNSRWEVVPDVDLVLTTREAARLLKMAGIDLKAVPEEHADSLLGKYSGAATIFGRTGGVMEAALRTTVAVLTGEPPKELEWNDLGTWEGIKRSEVRIGDKTIKVAVAHGLANARKVCESVRSGGEFAGYHFIEVMTCPGGCTGGGGQPIPTNDVTKRARSQGLDRDDSAECAFRMSHLNPEIKTLYEGFLEKPLSKVSHKLLHTTYTPRNVTTK